MIDESKPTWNEMKEKHTAREVDDYSGFIEGDYEPSLGKTVKILIVKETSYIVYIDEKNFVEWGTTGDYDWEEYFRNNVKFQRGFGLIINRVGYLEELSRPVLTLNDGREELLLAFERLLAESVGRLLDDKDTTNAITILNQAEAFLNERKRKDVLVGAISAFAVFAIIGLASFAVIACFTKCKTCMLNDYNYPYIIGVVFGALGGLLSIIQRGSNLTIEPSLDSWMCKLEGILRVNYGAIAALIFIFAQKCHLILNINNDTKGSFDFMLLFCIIVGYSERFIPSFMSKIEDGILKK